MLLLAYMPLMAQVSNFTLTLTAVAESCTANGSIAMSLGNATPGAITTFTIYRLPDTTTPVSVQTNPFLGGLVAGQYRVVATMVLGASSQTVTQNTTVTNSMQTLGYQLSGTAVCEAGGIMVNVTSGQAVSYEIISGPMTVPAQTSPIFEGLVVGIYVVRVTDTCGDALVQTYTLSDPLANFELGSVSFPECKQPACNLITVSNTLVALPGSNIRYPVTAVYTVYPPLGPAQTVTYQVASGSSESVDVEFNIPFFGNAAYTFDLATTDACGHVTTLAGNQVSQPLQIILNKKSQGCRAQLEIDACTYYGPVSVQFLSSPAGFDASAFHALHPGPHAQLPVLYASNTQSMPTGTYVVQVTDSCGRSAQTSMEINSSVEPGYSMLSQNCNFGQVSMPVDGGSMVDAVVIVSAPTAFSQPLPFNAAAYISGGEFLMSNLPGGTYVFEVQSVCLGTYVYTVDVPAISSLPIVISSIRGCGPGLGSISLGVQNGTVTQAEILSAPPAYNQTLPYDVSFNLADGVLYMNGFAQGSYTFRVTDLCSGPRTISINIPGYSVLDDTVTLLPHCGSFDLQLHYVVNEPADHFYWLQRWNPFNNRWEHPLTGVGYPNGTYPDPQNSYALENSQLNPNIAASGQFRVLRAHKYYGNGTAALTHCVETVKTFDFTGGPKITDAYLLPCNGGTGQIMVEATGLAPLQYFITTKDGAPFFVSNGNNALFLDLVPGIYNFQVRDACGNIVNRLLDFNAVPSPTINQTVLCDGQNGSLFVPGLDFLSFQWWNAANPGVILSTANTLNFTPFNAAAHAGTYVVRLYSVNAAVCTDQTVSYTIPAGGTAPFAGEDATVNLCAGAGTVNLFSHLGGAYQSGGNWTELSNSGALLGNNWMSQDALFGSYQFQYQVDGLCAQSDVAVVTIAYQPVPARPLVSADVVCEGQTLQLHAESTAGASYQWSGPNGFSSNLQNPQIANATTAHAGDYTVTASNGNCVSEPWQVTAAVLAAPTFDVAVACAGNVYNLVATATNGSFDAATAVYDWTGPDGFVSHENPVVLSKFVPGDYTLTVSASNGCSTTKTTALQVVPCSIPSGISPNGDGRNERFDLTGFDVERFKIYNRYGMVVYEQNGYTNQWYGQDKKGGELPDATYYYYIRTGSGEEKTGWVYVSR